MMKGERKLRLVKGGDAKPSDGDEPRPLRETPEGVLEPATAAEVAAAEALREALEAGEEPLFAELKAAHLPGPLAPTDLDAILARALGDDDASTAAERAAAERLRAELEGRSPASEVSALASALQLAVRPVDLPPARHQALIDAALVRQPWGAHAPAGRQSGAAAPRTPGQYLGVRPGVRRIAPLTMAALTGVAALAAGVALFLGRVPQGPPTAAWARARSADELFDAATPFPRHGQESARIDRIASARAADLRHNRFAAWGVR